MEINPQTKLADIISAYPFMRSGLADINDKFKALQSPMGKVMLKRATIADMSERASMPVDELIAAIARKIGQDEPVADLPSWWSTVDAFPVMDVRGATGNFFPGLKKRAESVPVGSGLVVVQSFEPVPLYDVMEGLGFERVTQQPEDGAYHVYFYRAKEGAGDEGIVFRPAALLNFPMIDGDLADLAVEFWDLTWNDERRHLPQEMRLLLSMAHALGAGRMRQASRELIKAYAIGCDSAALDDVLELVAWNSGIGTFASEIGPSTFFRAYKTIKQQEAKGTPRDQIVALLMERFGEKNPDIGVQ